jgi:hypothetical protein
VLPQQPPRTTKVDLATVAGERADVDRQQYKLLFLVFHVRYDRVVEDRIRIGPDLDVFSGEVVSTPQVSVQDLHIAMAFRR